MEMLGSSFKYRPPAKLLTFCEIDQSDIYQIMTLSSRFGGLCTALEKLLRSVTLFRAWWLHSSGYSRLV